MPNHDVVLTPEQICEHAWRMEYTQSVGQSVHELRKQIEFAKMQVLKNYPYMQQFLDRSRTENVKEALLAVEEQRNVLPEVYADIMSRANTGLLAENIDLAKLDAMLEYTIKGLMTEHFQNASFQPEMLYEETVSYLMMLKKMAYH